MQNINKQSGMTLLEVTASLAIGAIIIMGALSLLSSGSSAANSNALVQEMTSIRSSIKSMYLGQGSYGAASMNSQLIAAGKVPSNWTGSGSTISNSYGGAVVATGATTTFNITAGSIPKEVCVGGLPAASQGWTSVGVGATAAAALAAVSAAPWSPATSATNCASATQFVAFVGS